MLIIKKKCVTAADRSPERARELRRLVHALPAAHYATLRYLVQHLRRVVAHASCNKMEARNLAIVFGPTLVRAAGDDMLAMVNDMSSQCRIIESFLTHVSWFINVNSLCIMVFRQRILKLYIFRFS